MVHLDFLSIEGGLSLRARARSLVEVGPDKEDGPARHAGLVLQREAPASGASGRRGGTAGRDDMAVLEAARLVFVA